MASFDSAIKIILKHEGGYVNNPNDPGGATNYGISLRFIKDYPNYGDFDQDGDVDVNDIRKMTINQASMIYKIFWWDKFKYGQIADQTIATKIFDFSVNMGATRAHILLQEALNNAFDLRLECDGKLGPKTFHVLNAVLDGDEEQQLITAYCEAAWGFYQRLIAKNPKLKVFTKGWRNRAFDIDTANEFK